MSTLSHHPAQNSQNSYDAVPYHSYPYPQSTPDRMATIARINGVSAANVCTARALELGCAGGGNLLPLASIFPVASFVGIDLSLRQLDEARSAAAACGLSNVRWVHGDIAKLDDFPGEFDYIIAHGIYSWMPAPARDGLWRIISECLSHNGVAYVSYNTYPGWRMRGMVRDMMTYRIRGIDSPLERVRKARKLLDFLVDAVPRDGNAYGMLLASEL